MKLIIIALSIIFSLGFVTTATAQEKKVLYTCPLHPEVQKDKPGSCPKCGMTLEKKTITVKKGKSQTPKQHQANQP